MKPDNKEILARFAQVLNTRGLEAAVHAVAPMAARPNGLHPSVIAVADCYGITQTQLLHGGKHRIYSWPRQVAMFVLHELHFSYPDIAKELKLANHTTCLHGVDMVLNRPDLLETATAILERFLAGAERVAA